MSRNKSPAIIHVLHSLTRGGTERTLVALLRSFDPERFRHIVVTLREAGPLAARLPDHVACQPLGTSGRSWFAGMRLARLTRRWGAAVIHARNTCSWHDAIWAGLLTRGARLVLGFHGLETPEPFNGRQRLLARWGLRTGGCFTSVSHSGDRQLREQTRVPANRITVIPNGIDLNVYERRDSDERRRRRAGLGWDDATFVVGTVGALTPVKGQASLISAVARITRVVDNVRLLIVGDGPLRESLTRQANEEGIGERVTFTGPRDDIPDLLACMDAYVCSSVSEGMSNSLLEALASGIPTVATDVGDNALVVRDGIDGRIIASDSSKSIAVELASLARSSELRQRYASAARERAREFSFDRTAHAYEAFYESLVTPARAPILAASGTPATGAAGLLGAIASDY